MKIKLISFLIFSLTVNIFTEGSLKSQSIPTGTDQVLATVGNYSIYAEDFKKRYEEYLFSTGVGDKLNVRLSILNDMINEKLLYYYDENDNILRDPEYNKQLGWLKNQAVLAFLKDQEVYKNIKVTEEEARNEFYKMNQKLAARHLFAKTEEEAYNLYQLLQVGVTFEELAKQTFTDSILANNGGYLGYFNWGDFDPAFEAAAFNLKIGEISAPVKTEYGYSIIKLEDRVTRPIITENEFQTQKNQIIRAVKINKKIPAERDYINSKVDFDKIQFEEGCVEKIYQDFTQLNLELTENEDKYKNLCVLYNNRSYSMLDIVRKIDNLPAYLIRKIEDVNRLKAIIKGFILQDILLEEARIKGYDTLNVVRTTFEKMGTNLFTKYKAIDVIRDSDMDKEVVEDYYESNIEFFSTKDSLSIKEILVKEKYLADSLLILLKSGKDFGDLAAKFSLREITKQNQGLIKLSPLENFGNLGSDLWKVDKGEILGPVKISDVWGIFKIVEKKEGEPLNFEKIADEVELAAKHSYQKDLFEKHVEKLKEMIPVEINKKVLGSIKVDNLAMN